MSRNRCNEIKLCRKRGSRIRNLRHELRSLEMGYAQKGLRPIGGREGGGGK